jgi:putative adenylate-forming enzyme
LAVLRRRSPFYRQLGSLAFEGFPILDRATYVTEFDRLNTLGIGFERSLAHCLTAERAGVRAGEISGCTVGLSSGTGEMRGLFVVSPEERVLHSAHFLAKNLRRSLFGRHRIAYFIRADADLYDSAPGKRIEFQHFDLRVPIETGAGRLDAFDPTTLFAPTSILRKLGRLKREGKLKLLNLEHVLTGAENLDPLDRYHLERDFGLAISQVYQCTEGFIAYTCPAGRWHFNEDLLIIEKEYLDGEKKRFVPIITDLYRMAQPYVRYRISDVILENPETSFGPCGCGSILTSFFSVTGRESDLPSLPSVGTGKPTVLFHDEIQGLFFGFREKLEGYQFIQDGPEKISVLLQGNPGEDVKLLENEIRAALFDYFARKRCREPALHFGAYIEPAPPAKFRRIRNESA